MDPPSEPPSAPAAEAPAQKTAPLAPSQETAYRKKCIQLKRRLQEIEANNDATRRRIEREKQHIQKMRLNRAILLNHLKLIMEAPSKKLSPEQLAEIGVIANGAGHPADFVADPGAPRLRDGQALLDDSSDESEEEPEPAERPERRRGRNNPAHGESIMSTNPAPQAPVAPSAPAASSSVCPSSGQPALANVVPAAAVSPSAGRSTSSYSFQLESGAHPGASSDQKSPHPQHAQHHPPTPLTTAPSAPSAPTAQQPTDYAQTSPSQGQSQSNSFPQTTPPLIPQPPVRPDAPFLQFTDHMRPQLEADNYDPTQIDSRIQSEWDRLSKENRYLWEVRYEDQMAEYTRLMDEYKRQQRQQGGSFSDSRNRTLSGSGVGSG